MSRPPSSFFSGSLPIALVVGGTGFIGARLCKELLGKKIKVICVDSWQRGIKENLSDISNDPNFFLLEQHPNDNIPDEILRLNYVIDLAALEPFINGDNISSQTLEANSLGVKKLLDLSSVHGAKFLFASVLRPTSATDNSGGSGISHNEAKRFAQSLISEHAKKKEVDARTVLLGDVYGPQMLLKESYLSQIFRNYVYDKVIKIPTQEVCVYPIYIDDVVWGIVKSLLSGGTRGETITLAGGKSTLLELGNIIKSLRSGVLLEYVQSKETPLEFSGNPREGRGLVNWEPRTSPVEGIANTLYWLDTHKAASPEVSHRTIKEVKKEANIADRVGFWSMHNKNTELEYKQKEVKRKNVRPPDFNLVLLLVFAVLFWFFVFPFVQLGLGFLNLNIALNKTRSRDSVGAKSWLTIADFWFVGAGNGFSSWGSIPFLRDKSTEFTKESAFLFEITRVLEAEYEADVIVGKVMVGVFGQEAFPISDYSSKLSTEESALSRKAAFLEAEAQANPKVLKKWQDYLGETSLTVLRQNTQNSSEFLKFLPEILGGQAKKTYLVLIINNNQARPAGGTIVGYGLLTFDKARLLSSEFQPVDTADSQLTGHVDAPTPLKKYSEKTSWFLKDALWSSDFPTAATRAGWFIDKEINQSVDGVVGFDFEYLKNLLSLSGPVSIGGIGEISSTNFDKILTSSPVQQKQTPVEVTQELFKRVSLDPMKFSSQFAQATVSGLNGKHFILSTGNKEANEVLKSAGWNGMVGQPGCLEESCIGDYFYFSHANLSSVSDGLVKKSFALDVSYQKSALSHKFTVLYKNQADDDYKDYFKVLLPLMARDFSAVLVSPGGETQENIELDVGNEVNKTTIGGFINVPKGQERQLLISWTQPVLSEVGEYALLWQKQPGTIDEPFWLTVNTPAGYIIQQATPAPSLTQSGSVAYNSSLLRDFSVNIKWQKQK